MPKKYRKTLIARALIGQVGFILFTICLALLPLSLQMIMFQTNPFWASILAYFMNGESISRIEYIAMIVCFGSVLGIALSKPPSAADAEDEGSSTRLEGIIIAFILAWALALSGVINRTLKNVHFAVLLFYHGCIGLIMALLFIFGEKLITGNPFRTYSLEQYGTMLLCCCFDFLSINSQTIAYQSDSSGFVSLIGYMSVLYAFLGDYFIFHENISKAELCGAALILCVTVWVSVVKIREAKRLKVNIIKE